MGDKNNNMFIDLIWRNLYIKNHILSFLNSTPKLLPKYRGKINNLTQIEKITNQTGILGGGRNIGNGHSYTNYFKKDKIKYFKQCDINNVHKMAAYNEELLKYKVSKKELLLFEIEPGQVIFSKFKDESDSTIQFYINLFCNYQMYFITNLKTIENTINMIIKMDCLIAFKILIQLKLITITSDLITGYFINAFNNGSIDIVHFILENYKIRLENNEILSILKELLKDGNGNNNGQSDTLNKYIYTKEYLLNEYGFTNNSNIVLAKRIKSINYLSKLYQPQQQCNHSISQVNLFNGLDIKNKPLQFIIDLCYSICFLIEIQVIKTSSHEFDHFILEFIHPNPIELVLPRKELNEIVASFLQSETILTSSIEQLDTRDNIKKLLLMSIIFGGNRNVGENITFYKTKYQQFVFLPIMIMNQVNFILSSGDYPLYPRYPIKTHQIYERSKHLFNFCKNDIIKQKAFVMNYIIDCKPSSVKGYHCNKYAYSMDGYDYREDSGGVSDKYIREIGYKHVIFHLLIAYDNYDLIKMVVDSLHTFDLRFIKEIIKEYLFIRSIQVFDLFYNNKILKNHLNFSTLLQYATKNNTTTDYNNEFNTSFLLYHFKSTYTNDYYYQINNLFIPDNERVNYHLNDFIYDNYQDFKHVYSIDNILLPSGQVTSGHLSIELSKFITILENVVLPTGQEYCCPNNIEILAWVLKYRMQDISSGQCKLNLIDKFTILKCYYHSDRLSNSSIDLNLFNSTSIVQMLSSNDKFIKNIIKFNDLDDFKIIFSFVNQLNNGNTGNLLKIKTSILKYILKYNNISILSYINKSINNTYFNGIKYDTEISLYSIEVINYLIDKMNYQFNLKDTLKLFWRNTKK